MPEDERLEIAIRAQDGRGSRIMRLARELTNIVGDGAAEAASTVVGQVVGAASGAATGGPVGAMGGAVLGTMIGGATGRLAQRFLDRYVDTLERNLSTRERRRAVVATAWAFVEIDKLIASGAEIRPQIIDAESPNPDIAGEVYEGAIRFARDSFEERRVRHLGVFLARFSFMPEVDAPQGHHLLRVADQLSYRQFCLLLLMSGLYQDDLVRYDFRSRSIRLKETKEHSFNIAEPLPDLLSLLQEVADLTRRGFLERSDEMAILGTEDISPAVMRATPLGANFSRLLGLELIPGDDLQTLKKIINRPGALWGFDDGPMPRRNGI